MAEKPKTQVSKVNIPLSEKQQLVAGVFASKSAAIATMEKIKDLRPQLQMVNASNILVLAKDDKGKVDINIIDISSTSGVNIATLAERIAANLTAAQQAGGQPN
jgi:hypothetical protein